MALQNPKYQRASFDFVSPLITINQQKNAEARQRTQDLMTGVKDLVTGAANAANWYQRERKVEYIGDEALNKLKKELESAKTELSSVQNQMRAIKAEDIGSLDIDQDKSVSAETDVNAWNPDGGRMTEYSVDTKFGTQDPSMMKYGLKALGGF